MLDKKLRFKMLSITINSLVLKATDLVFGIWFLINTDLILLNILGIMLIVRFGIKLIGSFKMAINGLERNALIFEFNAFDRYMTWKDTRLKFVSIVAGILMLLEVFYGKGFEGNGSLYLYIMVRFAMVYSLKWSVNDLIGKNLDNIEEDDKNEDEQ